MKNNYRYDFFALFLLIVVTLFYVLGFLGLGLENIFGDLGDARLNNYFLEHGYQYIIGNHVSFWSAPFFYPAQYVMTYSDNHIGTLPIYVLYRILGYDIETSYQIWQISLFVLNSISAYLVLRLLKFNNLSSFVAALFFSLSASVMIKAGHIQLIPRFMVPFIFYGLLKYAESTNIKYFYIFCLALVYQFYIGIYIGFFAIMAIMLTSPFAIYYMVKNHGVKFIIDKVYISKLLTACLMSFVALYALFRPYIKFKETSGGRSWGEISTMLPRIESWIYTSDGPIQYLNSIGLSLPMQHEHMMFVGFLPIVSIIFSLFVTIRYKNSFDVKTHYLSIVSSLIIVFFIFVTTLYINGFSLYKYLFFRLPGFDAIRAVTRVILLLIFPLSILLAFSISSISTLLKHNNRLKIIILSLVVIGGGYEQYRGFIVTYNKAEAQSRYVGAVDRLSKYHDYDIFYYEYKKPSNSFFMDELDAMFISLILNKNTINGYSGNQPNGYWPMNSHRYDYWLNEGLLNFKNLKVLKYTSESEEVNIDTVYRTENDTKFSSVNEPLGDYSFDINLLDEYFSNIINLTIENNSNVNWPSVYNGVNGVALSYGLKDPKGNIKYEDRIFLPYDIAPRQEIDIKFEIDGLSKGANEVCFNMVQDGVRWFVEDNKYCTIVIIN
ncbi:hypothetical protein ID062_15300 [Vibrio cholerae]|uniref:hypothetical protein n=1 Tax=Vibrio cholerae TaxID=666 RepID=UPI00372CB124